jgi:hypothetical protein
MKFDWSILCFILAALAFSNGFITEYKQSREVGCSTVPTLPMAVMAALFLMLGLWYFPNHVPFWILPFIFFGSTIIFGYAIMKAHK